MGSFRHILFFVFFSSVLYAKGQTTEIRQVKKYTLSHGLSSYNIRKIIQDSKGFIWIATQDGLNRFDGKEFLQYNKNLEATRKICGADVKDILEDTARNLLWILTSESGINAIDLHTGQVAKYVQLNRNYNEFNTCLQLCHNKLWIGSSTGIKVYNIPGNNFEPDLVRKNQDGIKGIFKTTSLVADSYGNIWAGTSGEGILVFNGLNGKLLKKIASEALRNSLRQGRIIINNCCSLSRKEFLISTNYGLRKIDYDEQYATRINLHPCKSNSAINYDNIRYAIKGNSNTIHVATHDRFYRFNYSMTTCKEIREPDNITEGGWVNAIQCLNIDSEDNLWLGCQQGLGFIPAKLSPFTTYYYSKSNNLKLEHVWSVFPYSNKLILAGLRNGLAIIDNVRHDFIIKYETHLFHHIFADPLNRIHVSRDDGMFIYDKGKLFSIINFYPEFKNFRTCTINSHVAVGDSVILLGTENENGILIWNFKQKSVHQINANSRPQNLQTNIVNAVYKDNKDNVWILSDYNITVLDNKLQTKATLQFANSATKEPYSLYFDVCQSGGYYWVTSYSNGVLQLDDSFRLKETFNSKDGLCNDGVYQAFNVGDSCLLITTNNGLSLYNIGKSEFRNYYEADGLHSSSFEEACGIMKNEFIYVGGVKGFSIVDPKRFYTNTASPKLYINSISIKTEEKTFEINSIHSSDIKVPANVLQTNIHYSALNYLNPMRTVFYYKIKEIGDNWTRLGNQNFITLIGLNPGKYTIEVKAENEDGVPSEPVELKLHFLPKWYQTWYFKSSVALLVILAGYLLYLQRINQIKKEQRIRLEVAGDLHDDLGSTLNSVKVYTDLAMLEKEKETHLQKIKQGTQQAIRDLRDIIWVMDDKKGTVEHLVSRLSQFALPLCSASGIEFKKEIFIEPDCKLTPAEKKNLFMIMKEAINNSIKYAEATEISVVILNNKGKPAITIKDNGKGLNGTNNSDGNGLNNMKVRARQIHYNISIKSNKGLAIQLEKR